MNRECALWRLKSNESERLRSRESALSSLVRVFFPKFSLALPFPSQKYIFISYFLYNLGIICISYSNRNVNRQSTYITQSKAVPTKGLNKVKKFILLLHVSICSASRVATITHKHTNTHKNRLKGGKVCSQTSVSIESKLISQRSKK